MLSKKRNEMQLDLIDLLIKVIRASLGLSVMIKSESAHPIRCYIHNLLIENRQS